MSREVAPVEPAAAAAVAAAPPPASASGGDSSVAGDRAAHAAPNSGAGGAGGVLLAAATPGTARGDVPPDFGPYLARFRQRIQEAVVYPLAARRRGLAGRVEVELLLEPSGRVREVSVVASSTHAILDEAAVEAVRSLEPQPLPEQTKRQTLRVRLPVVFQIQ
jgi:protein TonB